MTLHVHTARMGYRGPDWLDVTLGGNRRRPEPGGHRGVGLAFAPSRELLESGRAGRVSSSRYAELYTAEMRASYREHRSAWDTVLSWERVVLLCFCTDAARCHRSVLAGIFGRLGAVVEGEDD